MTKERVSKLENRPRKIIQPTKEKDERLKYKTKPECQVYVDNI